MPAPDAASKQPSTSPGPVVTAQTPCWECQRRHWECDAARPVCNRCRDAGIVCPGYNDCKPLTWLAPGRVSARPRRQRGSKARVLTAAPTIRIKSERPADADTDADADADDAVPVPRSTPAKSPLRPRSGCHAKPRFVRSKTQNQDVVGEATGRAVIRPQRQNGLHVIRHQHQQPVARIPRLLRDPLAEMHEATHYYNSQIYPYLAQHQLAPNPFVAPIVGIGILPTSMRHALISLALGHRILQLAVEHRHDTSPTNFLPMPGPISGPIPGPVTGAAGKLWLRIHYHVGSAIRALNEEIAQLTTQTATVTMVSVFVFLITELFQSASPQWRSHSEGFSALLKLRGGIEGLVNDPEEGYLLRPGLLTFTIMSVIANTTSPSYDLATAAEHFNTIDTIEDLYAYGLYPRLPCPVHLFLEIVRINDLRHRLAAGLVDAVAAGADSALQIHFRSIIDFSPEEWATEQATSAAVHSTCPQEKWLLVAEAFQSAVLLFVDSSSASLLPLRACSPCDVPTCDSCSARLGDATRSFHRARLFRLVEEGLGSHFTMYCVIWPLIVAGFEANQGTPEEQALVQHGLTDLCLQAGATTMVARDVLRKFWASGKTSWDECFDQPRWSGEPLQQIANHLASIGNACTAKWLEHHFNPIANQIRSADVFYRNTLGEVRSLFDLHGKRKRDDEEEAQRPRAIQANALLNEGIQTKLGKRSKIWSDYEKLADNLGPEFATDTHSKDIKNFFDRSINYDIPRSVIDQIA
ncbi:Uncharacterized protein TPAR_03551 [Tolypocladium paradoxum]|uniref:Zn(2)-C6 fungal-type domain-containing protein n=1 Tax=Tolypocladium paradoxum TaxID=94208 RepID=A0A2S4L1F1_9HYPO|nr:Uncharacterized protein TPAR_03551 [Tolypocladium paradoxum]